MTEESLEEAVARLRLEVLEGEVEDIHNWIKRHDAEELERSQKLEGLLSKNYYGKNHDPITGCPPDCEDGCRGCLCKVVIHNEIVLSPRRLPPPADTDPGVIIKDGGFRGIRNNFWPWK